MIRKVRLLCLVCLEEEQDGAVLVEDVGDQ
jgi:hypothetical protein